MNGRLNVAAAVCGFTLELRDPALEASDLHLGAHAASAERTRHRELAVELLQLPARSVELGVGRPVHRRPEPIGERATGYERTLAQRRGVLCCGEDAAVAENPQGAPGSEPPSRLADVIHRLRTIEASASRSDGVACFARLYREVTEGVAAELREQGFADSQFLTTLDTRFADLFFSALESYGRDPTDTPSAWVPLFAQRSRRGVAPLQFAFAGMNAHINRDLPVALVTTCHELGLELLDGSREHADYERVDALLGQVEARVKRSYLTGWVAWADRLVHRLRRIDDVVAMWDVDRARDAAWTNAQALWALRGEPPLADDYLLTLDRMVGLASRGLLIPADSWLLRLGRVLSR